MRLGDLADGATFRYLTNSRPRSDLPNVYRKVKTADGYEAQDTTMPGVCASYNGADEVESTNPTTSQP
jgi:hypothetical protein